MNSKNPDRKLTDEQFEVVQIIAETLELSIKDVQWFYRFYCRLDNQQPKVPGVDVHTFMDELGIEEREFTLRIFAYMGEDKRLYSFSDFLEAYMDFCLLGKKPILEFMFNMEDTKVQNVIPTRDAIPLITSCYNKPVETHMLTALEDMVEAQMGDGMTVDILTRFADEYPNLTYPLYNMQVKVRTKLMGEKWWSDRLQKLSKKAKQEGGKGGTMNTVLKAKLKDHEMNRIEAKRRANQKEIEDKNKAKEEKKWEAKRLKRQETQAKQEEKEAMKQESQEEPGKGKVPPSPKKGKGATIAPSEDVRETVDAAQFPSPNSKNPAGKLPPLETKKSGIKDGDPDEISKRDTLPLSNCPVETKEKKKKKKKKPSDEEGGGGSGGKDKSKRDREGDKDNSKERSKGKSKKKSSETDAPPPRAPLETQRSTRRAGMRDG